MTCDSLRGERSHTAKKNNRLVRGQLRQVKSNCLHLLKKQAVLVLYQRKFCSIHQTIVNHLPCCHWNDNHSFQIQHYFYSCTDNWKCILITDLLDLSNCHIRNDTLLLCGCHSHRMRFSWHILATKLHELCVMWPSLASCKKIV